MRNCEVLLCTQQTCRPYAGTCTVNFMAHVQSISGTLRARPTHTEPWVINSTCMLLRTDGMQCLGAPNVTERAAL